MPRKLRYTEALGLNARGLEKAKRKANEAKRIAASQVPLTFFDRTPKKKKRIESKNEYWDSYNGIMQKCEKFCFLLCCFGFALCLFILYILAPRQHFVFLFVFVQG